jgi:hypothetical protein
VLIDKTGEVIDERQILNDEAIQYLEEYVPKDTFAVLEATRNWPFMYDLLAKHVVRVELANLCWVLIRSTRCQGSLYSFWVQENEFKDLEKPDGLRFVRGAQFERFRNGLITPRIRVRTLYKGGWKEKGRWTHKVGHFLRHAKGRHLFYMLLPVGMFEFNGSKISQG